VTDLTEPVDEPQSPEVTPGPSQPVDPTAELARRNSLFGWALFGLWLLLFAGVWIVAFIYLALD